MPRIGVGDAEIKINVRLILSRVPFDKIAHHSVPALDFGITTAISADDASCQLE